MASQEDILFTKTLMEQTVQNEQGTYVLPLPFQRGMPDLPNNRPQAERRLTQFIKKLKKDASYKEEYFDFVSNLIKAGHTERVPETIDTEPKKAGICLTSV